MKAIDIPNEKYEMDTVGFRKRSTHGHLIVLVILLLVTIVIGFSDITDIKGLASICISIVILEIISRFIDFCMYKSKLTKDVKYLKLLCEHLFDFNKRSKTIFGVIVIIIAYYKDSVQFFTKESAIAGCIYLLFRIVNIEECVYQRAVWLESGSKGLDYGSCLARGFFYGYLKIMLPHRGDENKGIYELMEQYESVNSITIPVKKLFVLIPTKLYCPPDLSTKLLNGSDVYLEASTFSNMERANENLRRILYTDPSSALEYMTLDPIERDVCGVKRRTYKNSVYKICNRNRSPPIYIVAEGASPLSTMHKCFQHASKYQREYQIHKDDIVRKFYTTLKELIDTDVECKNLCELIYYDDSEEDINIAKLLLQKVNESIEQSKLCD